jgi:phospholipid/cholesterol/gamma-HCH transport system substrate-binding protein
MATPARLVGVGVFVIGGVLLFTVGLFMIGDRQMAFSKKVTIYTEFKKVTGLQPGAIVRVSGAKAGAITQIDPPATSSGKFRVEFEITEALHRLVRTDSLATIETEGLVGGSYLGVGMGSDAVAEAAPKSTIPSKEPFEIAELMQQMGDTIKKVNGTIDAIQTDIQSALVSVGDTVNNANTLMAAISTDVKSMAANGAKIGADAAEITASINSGKGSLGKLVNDDELYVRVTAVAKQADEVITNVRQVVDQAKTAIDGIQSKDGPLQNVAVSVTQTMDEARAAMAGFAENMDALKHNFLVRGYFNRRGYFALADISPAAYRQGILSNKGARKPERIWIESSILFEPRSDAPGQERLSAAGKARLDAAVAPYLESLQDGVLMVEGYAQQGARDEQFVRSQSRGALARDYLIAKFHLDPQATGFMPLAAESTGSPNRAPWDGVALAVFRDKPKPASK